jgi:hypothetical protein
VPITAFKPVWPHADRAGSRLHLFVRRFAHALAQATWDAGRAAVNAIYENVQREDLNCEFACVPGYLHLASGSPSLRDVRSQPQRDAQIATEHGFDAYYLDSVPFFGTPGSASPIKRSFIHSRIWPACLTVSPGPSPRLLRPAE